MNDRLRHIYEVAMVAMSENGYHGTSMRDIATAVGIQTPSLYNYFSGKQDLLFQLMRAIMEDLTAETRRAVNSEINDPARRLSAAIRAFVLFNTTHPNEAAVSDAGLSILDAEQREQIIVLRDAFDGIYTDLIRVGIEREVFRETDATIAKNAITSACARIYLWYRPVGRYSPQQLSDSFSKFLMAGLLKAGHVEEDP